jgi:hypothetical protein
VVGLLDTTPMLFLELDEQLARDVDIASPRSYPVRLTGVSLRAISRQ